jgi:hypothetical protein
MRSRWSPLLRSAPRVGALASAVALALVLVSALVPELAQAQTIIPRGIGKSVFDYITNHLAPKQVDFTDGLVRWLVFTPLPAGPKVEHLRSSTSAAGTGLLCATMSWTVVNYWLVGLGGLKGSGLEAIEGIARTIGALIFIQTWPWVFDQGVGVTNVLITVVLPSRDIAAIVPMLARPAALSSINPLGFLYVLVFGLLSIIALVSLVFLKVAINAMLPIMYVGVPLGAALWPLSSTSWILTSALRSTVGMMLVPLVQALMFAVVLALGWDAMLGVLSPSSGPVGLIVKSMSSLALMLLCVAVPLQVLKLAAFGGVSMGHVPGGHMLSFLAAHSLHKWAFAHVPRRHGGSMPEDLVKTTTDLADGSTRAVREQVTRPGTPQATAAASAAKATKAGKDNEAKVTTDADGRVTGIRHEQNVQRGSAEFRKAVADNETYVREQEGQWTFREHADGSVEGTRTYSLAHDDPRLAGAVAEAGSQQRVTVDPVTGDATVRQSHVFAANSPQAEAWRDGIGAAQAQKEGDWRVQERGDGSVAVSRSYSLAPDDPRLADLKAQEAGQFHITHDPGTGQVGIQQRFVYAAGSPEAAMWKGHMDSWRAGDESKVTLKTDMAREEVVGVTHTERVFPGDRKALDAIEEIRNRLDEES